MGSTLELRLSEIVGRGNNHLVSFGFGDLGAGKVPLVEIVLKDGRLVEIPVNGISQGREQRYELKRGDEALRVYPGKQVIQVVDNNGGILSEQSYGSR